MTGPTRINAATLGVEASRATWALAAHDDLAAVAGGYHAMKGYARLAEDVQERTGIHTSSRASAWMGDVLFRVAQECQRRGEPNLVSLCVDGNKLAEEVYVTSSEEVWGARVTDPVEHAAYERLECYRRFGADLPSGGGEPAIPVKPAPAPRMRQERPTRPKAPARTKPSTERNAAAQVAKATEKPLAVCPTCYTALPASGQCDFCD